MTSPQTDDATMLRLMALTDSALDPVALSYVRALLRPRERRQKMAPVLAAAAFAAICAVSFATVMVLAPATVTQHIPNDRLG